MSSRQSKFASSVAIVSDAATDGRHNHSHANGFSLFRMSPGVAT